MLTPSGSGSTGNMVKFKSVAICKMWRAIPKLPPSRTARGKKMFLNHKKNDDDFKKFDVFNHNSASYLTNNNNNYNCILQMRKQLLLCCQSAIVNYE